MKKTILASVTALLAVSGVAFAHGGPEGLSRFDRDGNGVVTRDEMRTTAIEHFEKSDTNKDGKLTLDELQAEGRDREAKHFAEKDKNGDGKLSRAEVAQMPDPMFQHLDKNGDGFLTKDELEGAHGHMAEGAAHHFEHEDKNHDGSISRDEMLAEVDQRFAHLDKNADGVLSGDEMKVHGGPGGEHACHHDGSKAPPAR